MADVAVLPAMPLSASKYSRTRLGFPTGGLPLSVGTHAANHHEVTLVQLSFEFYMIEATPEHLIGDKAYDSDPLDAELKVEGVEMIAPHRKNRKRRKTQDGRPLRRYVRRWKVEHFFA